MQAARQRPEIGRISTLVPRHVPQIYADIDRSKVLKVGVPLADVNTTLGALLGSTYVNDFNRFGRVYKVYVQAEPEYRRDPKQFGLFFVRGDERPDGAARHAGDDATPTSGPEFTNRFNLYRSAEAHRRAGAGLQLGAGARPRSRRSRRRRCRPTWATTGRTCRTRRSARPNPLVVFALAILLVFLVLAAQYESWGLPFSVLLGTPFAAFGAYFGLWVARQYSESYVNNVFAQIGLIMLIGLAAKNAILIVEFAKMLREQGKDPVTAALEGGPAAVPADPDDRVRVHPRRGAAAHAPPAPAPKAARSWAWPCSAGMLIATFLAVLPDSGAVRDGGEDHRQASTPRPRRRRRRRRHPTHGAGSMSRALARAWQPRRRRVCSCGRLVAGCRVGPNYKRPDLPPPASVSRAPDDAGGRDRWPTRPGGRSSTTRRCRR